MAWQNDSTGIVLLVPTGLAIAGPQWGSVQVGSRGKVSVGSLCLGSLPKPATHPIPPALCQPLCIDGVVMNGHWGPYRHVRGA